MSGLKRGRMSAFQTIAMLMAEGVQLPSISGTWGKGGTDEERKFLDTLSDRAARSIWSRRIARGLTASETDYIRGRLKEYD